MPYRVNVHPDAASFLRRAEGWLLRSEAENNLILALAHGLLISHTGSEDRSYLATVEEGAAVAGCALRTPPHKLVLTRLPDAALPVLVDDVARVHPELPAVLGPEAEAVRFGEFWSRRTGAAARPGMRQRIYELVRVVPLARVPPGRMRPARPEEADRVAAWAAAFAVEAGVGPARADRFVRERITTREIVVWEDGEPVSMAARSGRTPNGVRVGFVYTPPEHRGRGYASACVAALSQEVLDEGFRSCFLYTDLSNPTSNAIYQRIGYRPVSDVIDVDFQSAG